MEVLWFSPLESTRSLLMWGVFLGVAASLLYLLWLRARDARVLKRLLEKECRDEASALSAGALGVSAASLRRAANTAATLAGEGEEARAYIPEEKRAKAEYLTKRLGWKWWQPALAIVLFYAAMLALHAVLPLLLD